jgi:hypothetical protein
MVRLFYSIHNNGARPAGFEIMKVKYIVTMLTVTVISTTNGSSRGQNANHGGRKRKRKAYQVLK